MICKNCGYENPDTAKFCNECGEKLESEITCPECGCKNKVGAKFCNECGYRFIQENNALQSNIPAPEPEYKTCPKCGGKNQKNAIMCESCGEYFPPPPKPLSDYVSTEKPNNENSARKCPNCGYDVGENDICDSCGYDVTQEKYVLSDLVDSEKSEVILGSIDEIEKKKNVRSIVLACVAIVAVASVIVIAAYNIINNNSSGSSNAASRYTSTYATTEPQPIQIKAGDVSLEKKSELLDKEVVVSGYVDILGVPEYNEKYGYVTYYLTLSDNERVQVNYSGEDASTIAFNIFDILKAEGVVTDVYKVDETILQISCKKISKTGVATPPPDPIFAAPTPAPTIDPAVAQQMAEERAAQEKAEQEAAKANSLGLSLNEFYTSFNSIAATNGLDAFLGKASTIGNVTTYATLDSGVSLDCTVINDYVDSVSIEVQRNTESLIASSYYVASAALSVDSSLSMQEADSVLTNLINGASANPGNDYRIVNNGITYIANVYNTFVFFYITK